jgi:uncharacterized protein DUF3592
MLDLGPDRAERSGAAVEGGAAMAMELCVNDKFTTDPSPGDISGAIDSAPHPEDWCLILDDEEGRTSIEVSVRSDGDYDVTADDGEREGRPSRPLSGDQVKTILLKFRGHQSGWRDHFDWEKEVPRSVKRSSEPPTWAVVAVIASVALIVLAGYVRDWLPFGDSDYFWIGLIFLPMAVLFVAAVVAKMLEVRRAADWSTAVGRIVSSGTGTDHRRSAGEATTVKSVPVVEYEFSVGGKTVRGNRIGIGEDAGGTNTEATLRRYPVGATVTVFYDPANPRSCVLERGVPEGIGKGLAVIVGFVVVFVGVVWWLATRAPGLVAQHYPKANAPVVVIAASIGVLMLLFFIASWKLSRRAANWPLVRGTVLSSGTERVSTSSDGRKSVAYTPAVEYGYRVNDVDYVSRQIKIGVVMSASESYAAGVAARYPKGATIDVHYDPANPSNAALENPTGTRWFLLVVAAALFALAAHQAGVFS